MVMSDYCEAQVGKYSGMQRTYTSFSYVMGPFCFKTILGTELLGAMMG